MEQLAALTDVAFQYGPFLFALLFNLVITRWGHNIYLQACTRKDPPAAQQEIETYRLYFLSMAGFGILLVVASIAWWIAYQPNVYVFTGEIKGLREYESVTSSNLYFRPVLLRQIEPEAPQLRNEQFMVVQNRPFAQGQEFELLFSKGRGSLEQFSIYYNGRNEARYRVEWDDAQGRSVLKDLADTHSALGLLPSAHAEDQAQPPADKRYLFMQRPSALLQPRQADGTAREIPLEDMVGTLQDEKTGVGGKIAALERLLGQDPAARRQYLETATDKESLLLTVMDLTRHTDRELAFKARQALKDFPVETFIRDKLLSTEERARNQGALLLQRLDKNRAQGVLAQALAQAPEGERRAELASLQAGLAARGPLLLVPTGTADGDRYYVQAAWDPQDQAVQTCLERVFQEWRFHPTDGGLGAQNQPTPARLTRLLYTGSKYWAVWAADHLRECGADAQFTGLNY